MEIDNMENGSKKINEEKEQKNPYQEVMDLPDNEIMDFAKGIEMARKAAIWKINNG